MSRTAVDLAACPLAEISFYAAAQKEDKGLDKCVEEAKYRMKRYGVTPNLLVIPPQERARSLEPVPNTRPALHRPTPPASASCPQLALYMSLAPDEKIT